MNIDINFFLCINAPPLIAVPVQNIEQERKINQTVYSLALVME